MSDSVTEKLVEALETQYVHPAIESRRQLLNGATTLMALAEGIDLKAFPLPMHVSMWGHSASFCWNCAHDALHIYMKILPRSQNELRPIPRDEKGLVELNTCTGVTQLQLDTHGVEQCMETIRGKVKDMVMHEMYEAFLFRGERIYDPHSSILRPEDQPF